MIAGVLFAIACVWFFGAFVMFAIEHDNNGRTDPLGSLFWPWWLLRYTRRLWIERTHEFDLAEREARKKPRF